MQFTVNMTLVAVILLLFWKEQENALSLNYKSIEEQADIQEKLQK